MLLSRSLFSLMLVSSVLVALVSYRFIFLDLSIAFSGMSTHITNSLNAFMTHIIAAPMALILGAVQFLPIVQKRPPLHRWIGRLYGVCVLVASIAGLYIAIGSEGGPVASIGFAALACVWFAVTAIGVAHARAGRFVEHRQWMIRSFALTFAGVTLRMQLLGFGAIGLDYTAASVYLAWTCWLPNIAVVEWWLRRQLAHSD